MAGDGQGQGQGGGYPPPPMGGYPQYNYPPQPTPTFPNNANAQSPLYAPQDSSTSYNSYLNNMMPTPQHNQTSSSTSSEFQPTQSPSTASLQTNSQSNSGQINIDISEKIAPASTIHYGEAPKIQPRRYKQQKVTLSDGHFIYDCPVSTKLTKEVPLRGEEEFDKVRYTACTCDPDDFQKEKYLLRQQIYGREQIEIFIVITMYNEEAKLFARTFYGVVKNIHELCKRERSRLWGKDGWKKVVVCVVSDGFEEIDKTTKAYLSAIGAYQEGVVKKEVNKKPVTAHIFEYTTQLCLDPDMKPVGEKVGFTPIQVLFCLKEENTKKINSHRWFFNAFGRNLKPNVCILLDAGTKPGKNSIYHLWKAFDTNPYIGGACGEIVAMKGKHGKNLLNPLVAAQNFEYKMSNILDKPLESVFGYITVLPGAFSAYRYRALQNQKDPDTNKEVGPLASYFLGEKLHAQKLIGPDGKIKDEEIKTGLFEANMYLAEDRILCFELISKKGDHPWLLHYVKSASAETDVPDNIVELIKQRRRWLNGSFFASLYSISHTSHIWGSPHSVWRKIALLIEMLYQTYNVAFSWFALGNIYLTFHILGNSLATDAVAVEGLWSLTVGSVIFNILRYMYIALIIFQFALALGNKPKSARWAYIFSTVFFAFLMFYMLFAAVWITYKGIKASQTPDFSTVNGFGNILKDSTFRDIVMSLISTYGLYFLASFLFFEPYHMFHSFAQYMLLVPFYINVLNVYAFCNIHDVSWGTKGDPKKKVHDEKEKVDVKEGGQSATVAMPENIDDEYERIQDLLDPKKQEDLKRQEKLRQEEKARNKEYTKEELKEIQQKLEEAQKESNAMFRTYVVFSWMVSNIILIALITNFSPSIDSFSPDQKGNIYFAIILWSVAILAAIRFFGSCIYLILRLFTERLFDNLIK
ncbi:chitin synthase CHS2 [Rhizophagus irregularis DAOM 197198w]|uniref:Chitin synthase n=1 Tax=Rhizophagus irregularis (strain DAOM 197198w) TaxID=1432141 RepID=A0A015LVU2_RHIIW|nr:chitin synthase CHS2 [Rhizophagus irregularis DAOM 197198w]